MARRIQQGAHTALVRELGQRITGGAIAPGSVLTLAGLEEEFGASRTVVREAVRVLETHGLVGSRRRVGITVRAPEDWDNLNASVIRWTLDGPRRREQLVALAELRTAVEPVAARLAAERADDAQRRELVRLAGILNTLGGRGEGDSEEYLDADIRYHSLLLAASGNLLLAQLSGPVKEILAGRANRGLTPAIPNEGTLEAHVATAAAIAAGDADGAEASARSHVTLVAGEVRELDL